MLKIGAIRKSVSPWASAMVLVRKKDRSLQFCINLRKLNNRTIKDAYSLPRIEDSLDCLDGAQIFTSLDLKVGYCRLKCQKRVSLIQHSQWGPSGSMSVCRCHLGSQMLLPLSKG